MLKNVSLPQNQIDDSHVGGLQLIRFASDSNQWISSFFANLSQTSTGCGLSTCLQRTNEREHGSECHTPHLDSQSSLPFLCLR